MSDLRFPILGTTIPPLLGREAVMQRIWNDLTKPTPSNLSIIGARFMGKTVMMNALAQRAANETSSFTFVLYWHLGHVAPGSDEDFIAQLCDKLSACLFRSTIETNDYRQHLEERSFNNFLEVADLLDEEGQAILMLWDGFDKPLGQGKLSGHLWDQMRTIFYGKKHKIVTASRKSLSELIRSQDAITSPFWNIFDMSPVRIDAFNLEDLEAIICMLPSHSFQPGAKTELINWSGGIPPLFLGLLNQVVADAPSGQVDHEAVNQAARKIREDLSDVIEAAWQDCPAGAKDLYLHLVTHGDVQFAETGREERTILLDKAFARQAGSKLVASCRILREHVQGTDKDAGSMARLFGSWPNYQNNIRNLLERRLAHISRFDERLYRLVERAIDDIPNFPDDCLNNLTGIRDCALNLIWRHEFGSEMSVPQEIIAYWTSGPRTGNKLVQDMMRTNCWNVPPDPLGQIRLLGLLTGSSRNFDVKAKATSKDAFVLLDAIHNFRNRAQHPDGQAIHLGVAVAAIMACLELLSCLERELH